MLDLALIMILGFGAQWAAWRLNLPSVLLLMVVAFIAGPVLGILNPNEVFGDFLLPFVSLAVGLILFEGGFSLRFPEIRPTAGTVWRLVTIGAATAWLLITAAAWCILGLRWDLALLLGAILTVTKPTVVIPMLRSMRLSANLGPVVKWEGIIIDPLMVMVSVLVYEAMLTSATREAIGSIALGLGQTIVIGSGLGALGAGFIYLVLKRHWVPDYLHIGLSLSTFMVVFTASNHFQSESGLLAVTLMGVLLANQRSVSVRHIAEFKEHLQSTLISILFIILTARLSIGEFAQAGVLSLVFVAVLVLFIRPASVAASTVTSPLNGRERVLLAWIAPRGIVATAVASIFGQRLADLGFEGAEQLAPVALATVAATVAVYGLTTPILARRLGLAEKVPQGILFVGAHDWARKLARAVQDAGFTVIMTDINWKLVSTARMEGLPCFYGSILSEEADFELDLSGIGRMMALTSNDEANALAALHCVDLFGRAHVYQLAPQSKDKGEQDLDAPQHLQGRVAFAPGVTFDALIQRFQRGDEVRRTPLSAEFTYEDFKQAYGESALPLFLITEAKRLRIFSKDEAIAPKPGQTLISLVQRGTGPA